MARIVQKWLKFGVMVDCYEKSCLLHKDRILSDRNQKRENENYKWESIKQVLLGKQNHMSLVMPEVVGSTFSKVMELIHFYFGGQNIL